MDRVEDFISESLSSFGLKIIGNFHLHHWDDFVTPEELCDLLRAAGLEPLELAPSLPTPPAW